MTVGESRLPRNTESDYDLTLRARLDELFREYQREINRMQRSLPASSSSTVPTAPAPAGTCVRNTDRTEQGTAGAKYILDGWEYTGSAWVERRHLTGN